MVGQLAEKVAVITGGSAGIGKATVELFVEQGARVIVGDINPDGRELENLDPERVLFVSTDVSDDAAVGQLVAAAVERFGRLDVMFNNAGANGDLSPLLELTATGFDETHGLLARSVLSGHRHSARQFVKQGGGGSIITTSSAAGLQGGWAGTAYTAAKHAVIGIARQATVELAPYGIRSNVICPGFTMTERVAKAFGGPAGQEREYLAFLEEKLAMAQPLGRVGKPRDIAHVAAFLASDASSFMCGAVIPVDGGASSTYPVRFWDIAQQAAAEFSSLKNVERSPSPVN